MDNVTVATITSIPLIFDAMPLEQFIVVVTLCAIFLLGLTLNLVAVTSIITRSPHQQVDVIDTYVLNACLAYLWMLLFSLLPYLVKYIAQTPNLLGFVASKFVFFLSRYPLYVLATLITAMAVHACWAGSQSGRHCYYRPAEWRSLLAVCVAWVSGLIAVIEVCMQYLSFTSTEVKILDFDQVLFYYYYYYFLSTFFFFSPYLKN